MRMEVENPQADEDRAWAEVIRQQRCPNCNSDRVVFGLYGLPTGSDELFRLIDEGHVALRGCVLDPDVKPWTCNNCGHAWESAKVQS